MGKPSDIPPPTWACRPRPGQTPKTIVITGAARGGTSFGASLVAHLGIPFSRPDDRKAVGRRHSHSGLMRTFGTAAFEAEVARINEAVDVWAFKHPAALKDAEYVLRHVRNPHYVIVFKEPLSVAMRSVQIHDQEAVDARILAKTSAVLSCYVGAVEFARSTDIPVLLISYDRAVLDIGGAIEGLAAFLGVEDFSLEGVVDQVERDHVRYFEVSENRLRRLAATSQQAGADQA